MRNRQLNMDKIAKGLGVERRGRVSAGGGYFGAMQLAALLIERTTEQLSEGDAERLVRSKRRASE